MRTEDKTPSAFMPAHVWKKQKSHLCEGRRGWRPAVRPESWTFFFFYIYIYASFFLFASSSCWNRVVLPFSYGSVLVDQFAPRPLYDSLPPKLSIPRLLLTTEEKSLCTHTYTKGERERARNQQSYCITIFYPRRPRRRWRPTRRRRRRRRKKNLENPGVYDARLSTLFFCSSSGAHIFIHTYV